MADIAELDPPKKKKGSKYPHGQPRNPERLLKIARLKEEGMKWRDIGPLVGMTGQGACLIYNHWKTEGWFDTIEVVTQEG